MGCVPSVDVLCPRGHDLEESDTLANFWCDMCGTYCEALYYYNCGIHHYRQEKSDRDNFGSLCGEWLFCKPCVKKLQGSAVKWQDEIAAGLNRLYNPARADQTYDLAHSADDTSPHTMTQKLRQCINWNPRNASYLYELADVMLEGDIHEVRLRFENKIKIHARKDVLMRAYFLRSRNADGCVQLIELMAPGELLRYKGCMYDSKSLIIRTLKALASKGESDIAGDALLRWHLASLLESWESVTLHDGPWSKRELLADTVQKDPLCHVTGAWEQLGELLRADDIISVQEGHVHLTKQDILARAVEQDSLFAYTLLADHLIDLQARSGTPCGCRLYSDTDEERTVGAVELYTTALEQRTSGILYRAACASARTGWTFTVDGVLKGYNELLIDAMHEDNYDPKAARLLARALDYDSSSTSSSAITRSSSGTAPYRVMLRDGKHLTAVEVLIESLKRHERDSDLMVALAHRGASITHPSSGQLLTPRQLLVEAIRCKLSSKRALLALAAELSPHEEIIIHLPANHTIVSARASGVDDDDDDEIEARSIPETRFSATRQGLLLDAADIFFDDSEVLTALADSLPDVNMVIELRNRSTATKATLLADAVCCEPPHKRAYERLVSLLGPDDVIQIRDGRELGISELWEDYTARVRGYFDPDAEEPIIPSAHHHHHHRHEQQQQKQQQQQQHALSNRSTTVASSTPVQATTTTNTATATSNTPEIVGDANHRDEHNKQQQPRRELKNFRAPPPPSGSSNKRKKESKHDDQQPGNDEEEDDEEERIDGKSNAAVAAAAAAAPPIQAITSLKRGSSSSGGVDSSPSPKAISPSSPAAAPAASSPLTAASPKRSTNKTSSSSVTKATATSSHAAGASPKGTRAYRDPNNY